VLGELINRSAAGARSAPKRGGAFLVSAVAASESSKSGHSSKLPKSSAAPKICDDAGEDVRGWAAPDEEFAQFLGVCISTPNYAVLQLLAPRMRPYLRIGLE